MLYLICVDLIVLRFIVVLSLNYDRLREINFHREAENSPPRS